MAKKKRHWSTKGPGSRSLGDWYLSWPQPFAQLNYLESQSLNPKLKWLPGLILGAVTLALYLPAVRHDFLAYDDQQYVTENPHVKAGLTVKGLAWAFGFHAGNWHPLTWFSHMLDCQVYGLDPAGHHLTNALLHAATTVLLFLVLNRMTGWLWPSAIVAELFGWHPLHVESVAWVAERKDVLSGLLWMATLWAYVRYVSSEGVWKEKFEIRNSKKAYQRTSIFVATSGSFYGLAVFFFALGLMSKPMAVTLPFVLLLLDYWPLGRWKTNPSPSVPLPIGWGEGKQNAARGAGSATVLLVLEKVPFFVLSAVACWLTIQAQARADAVVPISGLPIWTRVAHALISYVHYIAALFWPTRLAVYYPYETAISSIEVVGAAFVLGVISILAIWQAKKSPYVLVGWLWFVGTLVPVIGLVQVGEQAWADRYAYLPSIGLFVMVMWVVAEKLQVPNSKLRRNSKFQDSNAGSEFVSAHGVKALPAMPAIIEKLLKQFTLGGGWSHTPLKRGVNERTEGFVRWWLPRIKFVAATVMGMALLTLTSIQLRYWKNTRTLFEHTAAVTRNNHMAMTLLGSLDAKAGKLDEAVKRYRTALRWKPQYPEAHFFLGNALEQQGKVDKAIEEYQKALWFKPMQEQTHIFLGAALAKQGKHEEAQTHYLAALTVNPESAVAHNNLAKLLQTEGRLDEATAHYTAAIKLDANLAQAHNNLGVLLLSRGRTEEGVRELHTALRLQPGDLETEYNLGLSLNQQQEWSEAADLLGKVLEKRGNDANAHFHLGVALVHLGNTREAMSHYASALLIQPDFPDALDELSWVLATAQNASFRNGAEAVPMAQRACELSGRKDAKKLKTLAAAYAEVGQFSEAVSTLQSAIEILSAQANANLSAEEQMLEAFKAGKPWRDPGMK